MREAPSRLKTTLRLLGLGVMGFFILAPTPGNVGGCSDEGGLSDAEQFCVDRDALYCARDFKKGFIDEETYDACLADVEMGCFGFAWNPEVCSPPPSQRRIDACINALRSVDKLSVPNTMMAECQVQALCSSED